MTADQIAHLAPLIAALLASGAVAGVLAGLLGMGGGIVLVPAFAAIFTAAGYGTGQLMQVCLATSLATIVVTSLRSVLAHHRRGAVDLDILRGWAPGIVAGAVAGVWAVSRLPSHTLKIIFGGVLLLIAAYMLLGRSDWRLAERMPDEPRRSIYGAVIGFVSVLLGIGGGSLAVPMMTLHGRPIHRAVATAAGFGAILALPSVLGFLMLPAAGAPPGTVGSVNLPAFAAVIAMTLMTAPIGAALAHRTDAARLKRVFALVLMVIAANMLRKALI